MQCCFCRRPNDHLQYANGICLCPRCLDQLLSISPSDKTYRWFIAAMRRELSRRAQN